MVRKVTLGSSDLEVTQCCLGTMTMGSMSDEETSLTILDRYVQLGGNFLDTAEMYPVPCNSKYVGQSEEIIGRWLKARADTIPRESIVIATKIAGPGGPASFTDVAAKRKEVLESSKKRGRDDSVATSSPPADFSAASIRQACEASLAKLQTSYIDLYQLHWPERYVPTFGGSQYLLESEAGDAEKELAGFKAVVFMMGELISEGKIRHWGLSNETVRTQPFQPSPASQQRRRAFPDWFAPDWLACDVETHRQV